MSSEITTSAEFSAGRIYHALQTWAERQYFVFSEGDNARFILHQKINTQKNQRTIGFRLEDDNYIGWAVTLSENALKRLELRPVQNNRELAPILTISQEKIINKRPIYGVMDENSQVLTTREFVESEINKRAINHAAFTPPCMWRAKAVEFTEQDDIIWGSVACHPNTGQWILGASNKKGVFAFSDNDGESWTLGAPITAFRNSEGLFFAPFSRGWCIFQENSNLLISTNSLSQITTDIIEYPLHDTAPINAVYEPITNKIMMISGDTLLVSSNNGYTWEVISLPSFYKDYQGCVCSNPSTGRVLLFPFYFSVYEKQVSAVPFAIFSPQLQSLQWHTLDSVNIQTTYSCAANLNGKFFLSSINRYPICYDIFTNTFETDTSIIAGNYHQFIPHWYSNTVIDCAGGSASVQGGLYRYVGNVYQKLLPLPSVVPPALVRGGENKTYGYSLKTGKTIFVNNTTNLYIL